MERERGRKEEGRNKGDATEVRRERREGGKQPGVACCPSRDGTSSPPPPFLYPFYRIDIYYHEGVHSGS